MESNQWNYSQIHAAATEEYKQKFVKHLERSCIDDNYNFVRCPIARAEFLKVKVALHELEVD